MVKIALVQMSCSGTAEENTRKALAYIKQSAEHGANIVCLPELFQHPYFPIIPKDERAFDLAEPANGDTAKRLAQAAKENGVYVLGGSIYEREGAGASAKYYNTALVFDDEGQLINNYRKCHIPQDPGFYEKDYFAAGNELKVFDTKYGKICTMICFDQWFPEAARLATLQGAQLLVYPTAIGMPDNVENITGDWRDMWQTAQRGHAASNNVYVAAINRVGNEAAPDGTTEFFGGSFIADYAGKMVANADKQEGIIYADCDFKRQKEVQDAWCFLTNRRPDLYASLGKAKPNTSLGR